MDLTDNQKTECKIEPWGFNGWLLLLGFGLIVSPFRLANELLATYPQIFTDGTWEALMNNGAFALSALIIIEIIGNIGFLLLAIFLIKLYFKKSTTFPKWFFIAAASSFLFLLIDSIVVTLIIQDIEFFTTDTIKGLASALVALLIWSPYLFKSERSKNTFVQ